MPYSPAGIVRVSEAPSAPSSRRFRYLTNDNAATVGGAGYFNPLVHDLYPNCQIEVWGDRLGAPFFYTYIVLSIIAGVVTLRKRT